jgi:carbamoyl-phosphate synthase small subunit
VEGTREVTFDSGDIAQPVSEVSNPEVKIYPSKSPAPSPRIALIDCGAKANILRCLIARDVEVIRLPWNHDLTGIEYDGIFLSNGPGDPKACGKTIATVRKAMALEKPIFGICLGNQIMALAAGADTYKLPYGHRSQNQPCLEVGTQRCYITSQNHGYAVRRDTLPQGWESWFINANDGTVEGIRSTEYPFQAVQFHPEGCPGPRDTEFLIDGFIDQVREYGDFPPGERLKLPAGETRDSVGRDSL